MFENTGRKIAEKIDTSSIKSTTLFSFVMFAMILISFLWVLTSFFLDTYYQTVRTQEVIRTADSIDAQYRKSSSSFSNYAIETASINGIYIRIDNGAVVASGRETEQTPAKDRSTDINYDVQRAVYYKTSGQQPPAEE